MISCCLGAEHADAPECYSEIRRLARKLHECCECYDPIEPGKYYYDASGLWDGAWNHYRTCSTCRTVRHDHDCGDGWTFGELWATLAECYGEEIIDPTCDGE